MKIVVMGTGGVGGFFGARLAKAGHDVAFIARGHHLKAIQKDGLKVLSELGNIIINPAKVSDKPSDFDRDHAWPGFSYIIISVQKGTAISYRSWQLNQNRKFFTKENIQIVEENK